LVARSNRAGPIRKVPVIGGFSLSARLSPEPLRIRDDVSAPARVEGVRRHAGSPERRTRTARADLRAIQVRIARHHTRCVESELSTRPPGRKSPIGVVVVRRSNGNDLGLTRRADGSVCRARPGLVRIEIVADELFRSVRSLVVGRRRAVLVSLLLGERVVLSRPRLPEAPHPLEQVHALHRTRVLGRPAAWTAGGCAPRPCGSGAAAAGNPAWSNRLRTTRWREPAGASRVATL
jgi:hypothetical protein